MMTLVHGQSYMMRLTGTRKLELRVYFENAVQPIRLTTPLPSPAGRGPGIPVVPDLHPRQEDGHGFMLKLVTQNDTRFFNNTIYLRSNHPTKLNDQPYFIPMSGIGKSEMIFALFDTDRFPMHPINEEIRTLGNLAFMQGPYGELFMAETRAYLINARTQLLPVQRIQLGMVGVPTFTNRINPNAMAPRGYQLTTQKVADMLGILNESDNRTLTFP